MKTIIVTLAVATLAVLAATLVFVYSGAYDISATTPHAGVSAWLMHTTLEASVARRADDVRVPNLADESLLLAGVNDFEAMCTGCHGAPGKEPGPVGQGLNPAAPDLAESAREMSPAELFWVTKHGIRMTGMPAWSATHSDEDLWPVVALITALPDLDASAYVDLKDRAEGIGHHGSGASGHSHSHGKETAGSDQDGHDHGESASADAGHGDSPEEAEHDHGTHEH